VGALTLANLEPGCITPRSKFYAVNIIGLAHNSSQTI